VRYSTLPPLASLTDLATSNVNVAGPWVRHEPARTEAGELPTVPIMSGGRDAMSK